MDFTSFSPEVIVLRDALGPSPRPARASRGEGISTEKDGRDEKVAGVKRVERARRRDFQSRLDYVREFDAIPLYFVALLASARAQASASRICSSVG
jgi:hypothetical protein